MATKRHAAKSTARKNVTRYIELAPGGKKRKGQRRWIIASAVIVAALYFVRRVIEEPSQIASGNSVESLFGSGPVVPVDRWIVSYGFAFTVIAVVSIGAPELASAFAILILVVDVINSGQAVTKDLGLTSATKPAAAKPAVTKEPGTPAPLTPAAQAALGNVLAPKPSPFSFTKVVK